MLKRIGTCALLAVGANGVYSAMTTKDDIITVRDKQWHPVSGVYANRFCGLVGVEDGPTRQTGFHLWGGPYNSREVFDKLEVGHTYDIRQTGLGCSFLGTYPKIISVKEVQPECPLSMNLQKISAKSSPSVLVSDTVKMSD